MARGRPPPAASQGAGGFRGAPAASPPATPAGTGLDRLKQRHPAALLA